MQCPKCKAEVNQQAQFCWQCGATLASGPAPARPRAAGDRRRTAIAGALAALILLLAIALVATTRSRSRAVTAGDADTGTSAGRVSATGPGMAAPSAPLTAVAPGNTPGSAPLTAAPPANSPAGTGVAGGTSPAPDPFAEDVAAYLRKLETIQFRDSRNPMAQLFAMMAVGLSSMGDALKGLTDEGVAEAPAGSTPDYRRTFDQLLQAKQALTRDFKAITPVPQPCQRLHQLYGYYLDTQERAIRELSSAIAQGANPGAPLAALPIGKTAEAARAAATREEDAVRMHYRIPRSAVPIVP